MTESSEIQSEIPAAASALPPARPGRLRLRAVSVGSLALGALAVGAAAIGALAIGRLAIGRAHLGRVRIDDLVVGRLTVLEHDGRGRNARRP
jgi:hypothetical protein